MSWCPLKYSDLDTPTINLYLTECYKIKRLTFGTKTVPNKFYKFIDLSPQGHTTVLYFDDIVVHGTTIKDCNTHLFS